MKHNPLSFGRDRAGRHLRAKLEHRRQARTAALTGGALALALAIAAGIAGALEHCPAAAVLGICAACALIVATAAASEA